MDSFVDKYSSNNVQPLVAQVTSKNNWSGEVKNNIGSIPKCECSKNNADRFSTILRDWEFSLYWPIGSFWELKKMTRRNFHVFIVMNCVGMWNDLLFIVINWINVIFSGFTLHAGADINLRDEDKSLSFSYHVLYYSLTLDATWARSRAGPTYTVTYANIVGRRCVKARPLNVKKGKVLPSSLHSCFALPLSFPSWQFTVFIIEAYHYACA